MVRGKCEQKGGQLMTQSTIQSVKQASVTAQACVAASGSERLAFIDDFNRNRKQSFGECYHQIKMIDHV